VTRWGTHYGKNYSSFRKRFGAMLKDTVATVKFPSEDIVVFCDFVVRKPKTSKLTQPRGDLDNYIKALWDSCNGVVTKEFGESGYIVMRVEAL
jgi:Holliday junction resolvase RusA-like endonuclease